MPERAAKQERSIAYPPDDLVQRLDRVQAVGHEIREALTPLMLRAHAVLEDVPAERRASAEAVERSLARARTLLDQLHEEVLEARRLAAAGARGLFPPG